MCGRFEQHLEKMHGWVDVISAWPAAIERQFDIRPTNTAMTYDAQGWTPRRWSLVPAWSKTLKLKYATFNARAETLSSKPAFRDAWKHGQRCLVPASGYFEWSAHEGDKRCYAVETADANALMFAGLWQCWKGEEGEFDTFTIITTAALPELDHLHHRSPLMLSEASADTWLHGEPEAAAELLQPSLVADFSIAAISNPAQRSSS